GGGERVPLLGWLNDWSQRPVPSPEVVIAAASATPPEPGAQGPIELATPPSSTGEQRSHDEREPPAPKPAASSAVGRAGASLAGSEAAQHLADSAIGTNCGVEI